MAGCLVVKVKASTACDTECVGTSGWAPPCVSLFKKTCQEICFQHDVTSVLLKAVLNLQNGCRHLWRSVCSFQCCFMVVRILEHGSTESQVSQNKINFNPLCFHCFEKNRSFRSVRVHSGAWFVTSNCFIGSFYLICSALYASLDFLCPQNTLGDLTSDSVDAPR